MQSRLFIVPAFFFFLRVEGQSAERESLHYGCVESAVPCRTTCARRLPPCRVALHRITQRNGCCPVSPWQPFVYGTFWHTQTAAASLQSLRRRVHPSFAVRERSTSCSFVVG
uniref:Putative secreted protein n=1 Tax=Ixodes ricinus TaxID=34613 RepID=A0A6B0UJQ3_IXORI